MNTQFRSLNFTRPLRSTSSWPNDQTLVSSISFNYSHSLTTVRCLPGASGPVGAELLAPKWHNVSTPSKAAPGQPSLVRWQRLAQIVALIAWKRDELSL